MAGPIQAMTLVPEEHRGQACAIAAGSVSEWYDSEDLTPSRGAQ